MCIIVVKRPGVDLPSDNVIAHLWNSNKDGGGYCYHEPSEHKIIGHKGFTDLSTYVQSLRDHVTKDHTAFMHFRIATHGSRGPAATHPFPASSVDTDLCAINWVSNYGIAHNGMISGYGDKGSSGLSDSQEFVKKVLADTWVMLGLFGDRPGVIEMVSKALSGDRLAVMNRYGHIITIGKFFDGKDGLLFSNGGYMTAYHSTGNAVKRDKKGRFLSEKDKRMEKATSVKGQPVDSAAPRIVRSFEDDEDDRAAMRQIGFSYEGGDSGFEKTVCPNCRSEKIRSQLFHFQGRLICPDCAEKAYQDYKQTHVSKSEREKNLAEVAGKECVECRIHTMDGRNSTRTYVLYSPEDNEPLVQQIIKRTRGICGKKANWWVEVFRENVKSMEIYSSGKFFSRELGLNCGDSETLSNCGFFLCPEVNLLLCKDECDCANCGHFNGWESPIGHCGSLSPVADEEHQLGMRLVLGGDVFDYAPHLEYNREHVRDDGPSGFGIDEKTASITGALPEHSGHSKNTSPATKEEVKEVMKHRNQANGDDDGR